MPLVFFLAANPAVSCARKRWVSVTLVSMLALMAELTFRMLLERGDAE